MSLFLSSVGGKVKREGENKRGTSMRRESDKKDRNRSNKNVSISHDLRTEQKSGIYLVSTSRAKLYQLIVSGLIHCLKFFFGFR